MTPRTPYGTFKLFLLFFDAVIYEGPQSVNLDLILQSLLIELYLFLGLRYLLVCVLLKGNYLLFELFGSERSLRSANVVGLSVCLSVLIMLYSSSEEFLRVPKSS